MADGQSNTEPAKGEPAPEQSRPEPPPYRPRKDLIGYIERGQNPPAERRKRSGS
jgi:hypothetical protein